MADDITLTVRVRDMTRGDFDRLKGQLDGMRRNLQGVNRATASAGQHSRRLGQDIDGLSQTLNRMQSGARLSRTELTRVMGTLNMMSRSARQAADSGEITQERFHALNGEIHRMRGEFDRLGQGLTQNNNRLRQTGNQVNRTVRMVDGLVRSVNTTTRTLHGNTRYINTSSQSFGRLGSAATGAAKNTSFMGGAFSNLRQKGIGAAVALGVTLLPTIGALAPMLAGLGSIVGVAALAFSGLDKPTKFLSKSQKEFLVALKPVTKEFGNLRKSAQEAVLPKLTKNFDDVAKTVKDLNPVIKIAGDSFGDLVGKIARGVSSKEFMGPFLKNVKMGTQWVEDFAGSFGTFSIKFFEFGTKSQPALDAWQNLLGGFLDKGLPNMFKEMEVGVGGSSEWLNALAETINTSLLPGLGKLAAEFMKAFGPFLGEMLMVAGDAFTLLVDALSVGFRILGPFAATLTDAFRALSEVFDITMSVAGSLAKALGGALLETLMDVAGVDMSKSTGSFTQFSDFVKANSTQIRMGLIMVGIAIIDMVNIGIQMLPVLIQMFKTFSDMVMVSLDILIGSLVQMGGKLPGELGAMFRSFGEGWDKSKAAWNDSLDAMVTKSGEFAAAAGPNLSRAKVVLQVDQAKAQIEDIKEKLKDPELTKERRAKLTADKSAAEANLRSMEASLKSIDMRKADPTVDANVAPYFDKIRAANAAKVNKKTGNVDANTGSFWGKIRGLAGRVLGTSYINVSYRITGSPNVPNGSYLGSTAGRSANGNIFGRAFANGTENHVAQIAQPTMRMWAEPETGGEAYIPLAESKRPRSVSILDDVAGRFGYRLEKFAKGGLSKAQKRAKAQRDAERSARSSAMGDLTISHFGKMAGYKNPEIRNQLGSPDALGDLVSSLNKWRSVIKKTTHGVTESRLLRQLDVAGRALIKYEKNLTKVNKSLEKAKDKLDGLKQASSQMKESVTTGITSGANITKAAGAEDSRVTINTIMSQMAGDAGNSKQFAGMLKSLKAKGLSGALIGQIAEAGVGGGGMETAAAILGGGSNEIKRLNEFQKQIAANAKSAGTTAADAMYAAGIKAAEGLVKGLESQKKKIESQMIQLARYMEKAIKRALGIKSPSKVMEKVGWFTAEGFDVGMKKHHGSTVPWAEMTAALPTKGRSSGGGGSGGANGAPMIIQLKIGNRDLGEIVIDPLRRAINHRGGNVQAALGT
jgi:uncharacterized protein YoxC